MGTMEESPDNSLHDELAAQLDALDVATASGAYRVERVLKRSPMEETQLVHLRCTDGGELGPYVRKVFAANAGIGGAYEKLAEAQRAGARFRQLPRIVSCAKKDGRLEVVMEYIQGATLREVVERTRPEDRALLAYRLMPAVCEAVRELHEGMGEVIIHRDLTPSNVMIPDADPATPVLIDLGIARVWREGADADTTRFGTRPYAPPEQFGFGQTDVRSDVYALGMLAFFCLTGRDPEASDREHGFACLEVPEGWRKVIAKAVSLDPGERYGAASELTGAIAGLKTASPQPGPSRHATSRSTRFLTARNAVVLLVCGALIVSGLSAALPPPEHLQGSYAGYVLGSAVLFPCCTVIAAYALMDKRWLRENVSFFRERTPAQVWRAIAGALAAVMVVGFIVALLFEL